MSLLPERFPQDLDQMDPELAEFVRTFLETMLAGKKLDAVSMACLVDAGSTGAALIYTHQYRRHDTMISTINPRRCSQTSGCHWQYCYTCHACLTHCSCADRAPVLNDEEALAQLSAYDESSANEYRLHRREGCQPAQALRIVLRGRAFAAQSDAKAGYSDEWSD